MERDYNFMDVRTLKNLRAPMDHSIFRELYFSAQDVWARMHPTGSMPQATLLSIVMEAERAIAKDKARLAKKVPA